MKENVSAPLEIQTSETLKIGILLALSGGLMDAYSYICRGGVFANAQTGNMLLLGVNLSSGKWMEAGRYALPVFAFAMGIAIAEFIRFRMRDKNLLHWRQVTVFLEAVILLFVAFIPLTHNFLANSLTSLPAACRWRASARFTATVSPPPCASATSAPAPRISASLWKDGSGSI